MVKDKRFDEVIFDTYAHSGGERIMSRRPDGEIGLLFVGVYDAAIKASAEVVGSVEPDFQEIISRTNFWTPTLTFARSYQDKKWDVSRQLPETDLFHSDMILATLANNLSKMIVGYHRIMDKSDTTIDSQDCVDELRELSGKGVIIDSAIVRIMLALGVKYAASFSGPDHKETVLGNISERESSRFLSSNQQTVAASLYEDSQLNGAKPPNDEGLAELYQSVAEILQLETTAATLDVLGIMSKASPTLKKFTIDYYKQHKTMLFAEKSGRTNDAVNKLIKLLSSVEGSKDVITSQAAKYASEYIAGRLVFNDAIMAMEMEILKRIDDGYYENDLS